MNDDEVLEVYLKRKNRQLLITIIGGIIFAACFFLISYESAAIEPFRMIVLIIFLVDVIGMVILSLINFRCPRCNCYLGRERSPKFCKSCGVRLEV